MKKVLLLCFFLSASALVSNAQITVSATKTDALCPGSCDGTAYATAMGGVGPLTYLWSTGQTSQAIANLCAGVYTVTVTDGSTSASAAVSILNPYMSVSIQSSKSWCGGWDTLYVTHGGGSGPITYLWNNGYTGGSMTVGTSGIYSVTVTNANGCSASASISVQIQPMMALNTTTTAATCSSGGSATVSVTGGNPPFQYQWSG
jgi:hypothetical protein